MIPWLIAFGLLWITCLGIFSLRSFRKNVGATDYIFAGSNLGAALGMLTFAATLFSTFTLMGMPDFFRNHGVGAWIFLAVADAGMFFFILWFGHRLRHKRHRENFSGMSNLLSRAYQSRYSGWLYFVVVFVFLIPYLSIQIRGLAIFLSAIFPEFLPSWGWSVAIVAIMLIYSEIGGLRAIIYSDVLQACVLLVAIWIIGVICLQDSGGLRGLFEQVNAVNPKLLSTPGPNGLMTFQFLVGSMFAIVMIPVTQPQVVTRLVIMRSNRKMHDMVLSLGFFAFLVILPTAFIGLYGAIHYADAPTAEFLTRVLLTNNPEPIAALVVIGLLAAAISTSDSQIFALGTEFRALLGDKHKEKLWLMRLFVVGFGICALVFSILSGDELVLLARVSFMGTALLGPMILTALLSERVPGKGIVLVSVLAELLFGASLVGWIPSHWGPLRADTTLFVAVALLAFVLSLAGRGQLET